MTVLMIALTLSLTGTDVPGRFSAELPLRMSLFEAEAAVEVVEVPAPSFPTLIVAADLPSYAELQGADRVASIVAPDAAEIRPWTATRPATAESASFGWLKDWSQR
jgi:hypothetical protein